MSPIVVFLRGPTCRKAPKFHFHNYGFSARAELNLTSRVALLDRDWGERKTGVLKGTGAVQPSASGDGEIILLHRRVNYLLTGAGYPVLGWRAWRNFVPHPGRGLTRRPASLSVADARSSRVWSEISRQRAPVLPSRVPSASPTHSISYLTAASPLGCAESCGASRS